MTRAELLLKALTDEAAINYESYRECAYCGISTARSEDMEDPKKHESGCPWRLAKEYLQEKGA